MTEQSVTFHPQDPHAAARGSARRSADPGVVLFDEHDSTIEPERFRGMFAGIEKAHIPDDAWGRAAYRRRARARDRVRVSGSRRPRARSSHRRAATKPSAKSSDEDGEPARPRLHLDVDPAAAIELGRMFGRLMADMVADGTFTLDAGDAS